MKTFDKDGKYNFVDENNVFVGFDSFGQCCERFGYFFSKEIPLEIDTTEDQKSINFKEENYIFDIGFFKEDVGNEYGGFVTFRLFDKNDRKDCIYLNLYNIHEGYYAHGFEMTVSGKNLRSGSI